MDDELVLLAIGDDMGFRSVSSLGAAGAVTVIVSGFGHEETVHRCWRFTSDGEWVPA